MLTNKFSEDIPIYLDLKNQIIVAIAMGEYGAGATLPSVRALAQELEINMHTVNKTYRILREEGYITLDRRKGAVVLPAAPREGDEQALRELLLPLAARARCRGMGKKEFRRLCTQVYEGLKSD